MRGLYRIAAGAAATLLLASSAQAQQATCQPLAPSERVTVTTADGAKVSGTIVCLTDQHLKLLRDGGLSETPLSQIRRIATRPDPVWDGAAKGAAIPFIIWAVFCHECGSREVFQMMAGYGLIGLSWDVLQRNTRTIYAGAPRASVGWRFRF